MPDWEVIYAPEFEPAYDALHEDELAAHLIVLAQEGRSSAAPWSTR